MTRASFLLCSLLQQQQHNMLQNPASVNHCNILTFLDFQNIQTWEEKSPSTALHFRKMLLSIIKYLMRECFRNSSEYMDPKTSFYNTVPKETSFKKQWLHYIQSRSVSFTSKVAFAIHFCCYIWAYLLGVSSFCKDNLQQKQSSKGHKAILNIFLQLKQQH